MMPFLRKIAKPVVMLLVVALVSLSLPQTSARAAMVQTEAMIEGGAEALANRARLRAILLRAEARVQMEALGVDPGEALARVDSLSDQEVAQIAQRLDQQPAGSSYVNQIILILLLGVLGLIILVFVGIGLLVREISE